MLAVQSLRLGVGARVLVESASFTVGPGDRVGLVGRNGAGKTSLARVLAGETVPMSGTVSATGAVGYLPQDPRTGDLSLSAEQRILSARGLDRIVSEMRRATDQMSSAEPGVQAAAMGHYEVLEAELHVRGGYAAESEAAMIAAKVGLPEGITGQSLETLSGGQRRRVELARVLFGGADTLILDEPTNHLDADSIGWLREYLRSYEGGLVVISHDRQLIEAVVNRVFHLDAQRAVIDHYNVGWRSYLQQRDVDERRRVRARATVERKATSLLNQSRKMGSIATKATAAQNMAKRARRMLSELEEVRVADKVAAIRFPTPADCGRTPLTATGLTKSYGAREVLAGVDLAVDRGSRVVVLGPNGAGKTTLLRLLAEQLRPDDGAVRLGRGAKIGYYAQEHETLDPERSVLENVLSAATDLSAFDARRVLGSFLFSGDDTAKATRVLSGGEKTRLALAILMVSGANVLLLDEPTNNLDPASRTEILRALSSYTGAVVLVTHDVQAVAALDPERVMVLPEGVEDFWNDSYAEMIFLAE